MKHTFFDAFDMLLSVFELLFEVAGDFAQSDVGLRRLFQIRFDLIFFFGISNNHDNGEIEEDPFSFCSFLSAVVIFGKKKTYAVVLGLYPSIFLFQLTTILFQKIHFIFLLFQFL